jgi:dienelactone hydrolase
VVVIQHQYGVDMFMEEMTERFARDGYFAICPIFIIAMGRIVKTTDRRAAAGRATRTLLATYNATMMHLRSNHLSTAGGSRYSAFAWAGAWRI